MPPTPTSRTWRKLRGRRADERGTVAILVALSMTLLVMTTAMVLDFGLVRLDRQVLKNNTDSAALAGIAAGDGATGDVYSHRAVCGALASLRNAREFTPSGSFTGLPDSICASGTLAGNVNVKCVAGNATTYATYDQTVTRGDVTYRVKIEAPYDPTSGSWQEEGLSQVTADQSSMGGCDQVGVQIWESRDPGLGSIATSSDLHVGVRSAARALIGSEDDLAPALILLERTGCQVVTAGGTARVHVKGMNGTPGSIHVDSDASTCTSGQQLYQGGQADSIVAYGSTTPTGTSGAVTAYAAQRGVAAATLSNGSTLVYGTPSTSGTGNPRNGITGRDLVGRRPVDERYRTAVRAAIAAEDTAGVWNGSSGWTTTGCTPSDADAAVTTKLYINCPGGYGASKTLQASEVFINGFVSNATLSMPNATRVYVNNVNSLGASLNADAIYLGNTGAAFCVRTTCDSTATTCPSTTSATRARIFVRQGAITANGGQLRMCNSTVFMLGGDRTTGCVPATDNTPPTSTPCPSSLGTGTISVGGNTRFDWTAPNEYSGSIPLANRATAWNNFEDLAVWSESAGTYSFSGNGALNQRGIFMIPNASPVTMGGTSDQVLTNAQYVARRFNASGNAVLSLTTDPRNAVTIPAIKGYVLVR